MEYMPKRKDTLETEKIALLVIAILCFATLLFFSACRKQETSDAKPKTETGLGQEGQSQKEQDTEAKEKAQDSSGQSKKEQEPGGSGGVSGETEMDGDFGQPKKWLDVDGRTLETRIAVPDGYERIEVEEGSLAAFLRSYPMKEDGSPVLLYDGREKGNQSVHAAVFDLPMEAEDLQQCADSVIRVYAEYFWQTGQLERIAFHFTNGFLAEYSKWQEGYRIQVEGNEVSWKKQAEPDSSYESFQKYLRIVFAYAGTLSMEAESGKRKLADVQAGDIWIEGGSPGHVVLVVDVCVNEEGKKAFLLGQGYMPAQEFHVLRNPGREGDPWYYEEDISYPFHTPEYTFEEGSLRSLSY